MQFLRRPFVAFAFFATVSVAIATAAHDAQSGSAAELSDFAGDWLYVEDRTEGRPVGSQGPPMNAKFAFRVEQDAVVYVRGNGQEERITLDGSTIEEPREGTVAHYRGLWQDGVLTYELKVISTEDGSVRTSIKREFRVSDEGLRIRVVVGEPPIMDSVALYKHPADIALPAAAKATIDDLNWLSGAWVGARGTRSIEERWGPAKGGSMLGTSRTIRREKMVAFEYLRIVERDGGLVYVAQPGGRTATEFVLTELSGQRAVFENPRHDSPQRIVYELGEEGGLTATIGFINGGNGTKLEFTRE